MADDKTNGEFQELTAVAPRVPRPAGGGSGTWLPPPSNLQEALTYVEQISSSDLVPKEYRGKPGNILLAIETGVELGYSPRQALQSISIINGHVAVYGDGMLALVQGSGKLEWIDEHLEGEGEDAAAVCVVKRAGYPEQIVRRFSVKAAKRARLWGKTGPWTDYPQRMLQMRARSWALRDGFADILRGIIAREEAEDIPSEPVLVQPEIPRRAATRSVEERMTTQRPATAARPKQVKVPEASPPDDVPADVEQGADDGQQERLL